MVEDKSTSNRKHSALIRKVKNNNNKVAWILDNTPPVSEDSGVGKIPISKIHIVLIKIPVYSSHSRKL